MKKVRVRYAPSPTGLLHIGNARSALFNYLYARHFGGDFIVRIEDTDVARNVEGGEASQFNYLAWLGLDWNESPEMGGVYGPYRQLERLDLYTKYANELLDKGLAVKEFREDSDTFAIRFKVPADTEFAFDDLVFTCIPSDKVVAQAGIGFGAPVTSTKHMRQLAAIESFL